MADISINQILLWGESSIPENWQICDGTNGTPDLRGKFVYGASSDGDIGSMGGTNSHSHSYGSTGDGGGSHTHSFSVSLNATGGTSHAAGATKYSAGKHTHSAVSGTTSSGGSTHTHDASSATSTSLPPYIKLYYIARMA